MEATLRIIRVRSLVVSVWLHTATDPSDQEWDGWITQLGKIKVELKGDMSVMRSFVVSDGGAPNAKQRARLFNDLLEGKSPVAVITNTLNNPIKRGIATAISWLNPSFRAYPPERSLLGLQHIDCGEPFAVERIWASLVEQQRELPVIHTLRGVAQALGFSNPVSTRRAAGGVG